MKQGKDGGWGVGGKEERTGGGDREGRKKGREGKEREERGGRGGEGERRWGRKEERNDLRIAGRERSGNC